MVTLETYLPKLGRGTICSIHLAPIHMRELLKKLTPPLVLLGELNAHNLLLNSKRTKKEREND